MDKFTSIDRLSLLLFQREALKLLAPLAAECGVTLSDAGGSFDSSEGTVKFRIRVDGVDPKQKEKDAWKQYASLFGFAPEDLGRAFVSNGIAYVIEGLAPSRSKYPVVARRTDGKLFKFSASTVKFGLAAAPVARALDNREVK